MRLTLADAPSIYGCEPLFNLATEDALISLSFGNEQFLDWIAWTPTNICVINKSFFGWVRPTDGSVGYLADPCADPAGFEWDTCDFTLTDFARLRRGGPVRDITKVDVRYSWNQPRYRLDGSVIGNDMEFDARLAMEVILQDLRRMVITGDASTPGMFDGLQQLVKYGYTNSNGTSCSMMDSIVVDWNGNGLDGGAGITWNGAGLATDLGFISALIAVVRKIRHRLRMSPPLASQTLQEGDMILMLPEDFSNAILDAYTCWSVCDSDWNQMNTFEARTFRNSLLGGKFGFGTITIDSLRIPLMPYDYGTINGGDSFDAYLLVNKVGNIRLINGEFNNMTMAAGSADVSDKFSTDNGRFLFWEQSDHTCVQRFLEMQPRLLFWAPWAQARFSNIRTTVPGGIISGDPTSEYFLYP
jgi:hypothetical protein